MSGGLPTDATSRSRPSPADATTIAPPRRLLWLAGLVSLLGAFEMLMALSASSATSRTIGLVGGLALIVAPWVAARAQRWGLLLLLLGTVPFAVVTWWSVVTPVLAVVALAIGVPLTRTGRR